MEVIRHNDWELECDPELTRQTYSRLAESGPEGCVCIWCKNFVAAREQVYPPDALELLARLGVSPQLEAEVVNFHQKFDGGLRLYQGWWPIVGKLLSAPPRDPKATSVPFYLGFTNGYLPVDKIFRPFPLVYAFFWAHVPWVLETPEEDCCALGLRSNPS
jgi:hypothetical protein